MLTDYTLDFLEKNWLSEIDFVICTCRILGLPRSLPSCRVGTGDSARYADAGGCGVLSRIDVLCRHDNDRKLPRTLKEIYQLNRVLARRMEAIFTKRGIPVIPSIGKHFVAGPLESF